MRFLPAKNGAVSAVCRRIASDKDMKNEKEAGNKPGKENSRQREQQVQRVVRLEKGLARSRNRKVIGVGTNRWEWEG